VTPVYAFSKLYLFWVELKTVEGSKITGGGTQSDDKWPHSSTITRASIKFSYLDTDETWAASQTAADDIVVNYKENYNLDNNVSSYLPGCRAAFDSQRAYWQKVYALHTPAEKMTNPDTYPNGEHILINYGFGIGFQKGLEMRPPDPDKPPEKQIPADQYQFQNKAYDLIKRYNAIVQAEISSTTGYLQLMDTVTVAAGLTRSPLHIALIDYSHDHRRSYRPRLSREEGQLGVSNSQTWNTLVDDYCSDDYPQIPLGNGTDPNVKILLKKISGGTASLTTVKNLPGTFIFDNGDEAFLVQSSDNGILNISEVLMARWGPEKSGAFFVQTQAFTTSPTLELKDLQFLPCAVSHCRQPQRQPAIQRGKDLVRVHLQPNPADRSGRSKGQRQRSVLAVPAIPEF
jgi:hypothetical protein